MITTSSFKPAWWLPSSHLQTLWPVFATTPCNIALQRERIELPDGDFLDVDWSGTSGQAIVLILHGLGGSVESFYIQGILKAIERAGWRAAVMHFRGCSGEPNRLMRGYHCGETGDLAYVVNEIYRRNPKIPIAALGYSLGGNVLLKWLGETAGNNPLLAAAAVCVPFEAHKAVHHLAKGFYRLYQWYLLRQLRDDAIKKFHLLKPSFDVENVRKCNNFEDFDNIVTAPAHGFKNAIDYYCQASSRPHLRHIKQETLIIHALDDPVMTQDLIPKENELSESTILELSKAGGHVGFISGNIPGRGEFWLEQRIPEFFSKFLP